MLPPHYRWNFGVFLISNISFGTMMAFVSFETVTPSLVSRLTDSALLIGLVGTVFRLFWLLPQLPVARMVQDKPHKKPYLYPGTVVRTLSQVLVPVGLWCGLARHPGAMLAVVFAYLVLFSISDSFISVPWFDILARAIPLQRRGRLFGWGQALGRLTGIGVGFVVGAILGSPRFPFPSDYALIYALGMVSLLPSALSLLVLRETPPEEMTPAATTASQGSWLKLVRADPAFTRLVICRMLVALAGLASPFYVVHAANVGQLPDHVVGQFVTAQTTGGLFASILFGWLSDRSGPLWAIRVGSVLALGAPLFALFAHLSTGGGLVWIYIMIFVAVGILDSVWIMGFSNYLLEIAPSGLRPVYVGMSNTIVSLATLAPIAGGWILDRTSYIVLFAMTAFGLGAGFLVSLTMRSTYSQSGSAEGDLAG